MLGLVLEECIGSDCEQDPEKRKAFIEDILVIVLTFEKKINFEERDAEPILDQATKIH
jgi:hypothetical protein